MNTQKSWVLVTGGTRGIGESLVTHLCRHYRVVFSWRQSGNQAHALVERCRSAGYDVEAFQCDGTDSQAISEHAQRLISIGGAPHALINNAGITRDGHFLTMDTRAWLDVIDNNLNASFYWTRALLPSMVEAGGGSIIMMSSISAIKGNAGQTNYSATKAALLGLTRSLSLEVARFGVRVNAIAPGVIDTEMTRNMPPKALTALTRSIPMRRAGDAREVSAMTEYLIGEDGRYITGQCFVIDGGITA